MKIPHLENDGHALMAIGFMLAELEELLAHQEVAELPSPDMWVQLYSKGVNATRIAAGMEVATGYKRVIIPAEEDDMPTGYEQELMHAEPDPVPYTKGDGTPYAVPEATSDNLVSLMPCSVPGCSNQIPTTKSMAVCHEHEPKLDEGAELPVE